MKRSKITGLVGTLALHLAVLALLFFLTLDRPLPEAEGGVPVMLGNAGQAQGEQSAYSMTEVDLIPETEMSPAETSDAESGTEQPLITQTEEPSLQMKEQPAAKETRETDAAEKMADREKEKTAAEMRREAERAAAQAASSRIAGAFGKSSQMGNAGKDSEEKGARGSLSGNSPAGLPHGTGGQGTFDLQGRSLGPGGLPVPVYNVQDEGRVVVTIVVNPSGQVVSTSINKRTNTVNPALRRAAEEAARQARFNEVDGVNNQSGTITYYFKLK